MHAHRIGLALLALAAVTTGAQAQNVSQGLETIEIHGFGSWNSGAVNNENLYLGGKRSGSSLNSSMAVNVSGTLSEQLSFTTQVNFQFNGETEPDLDYVFAEWKFNDRLKLRAGQVKQPFGLYTEIQDVGTLRPFLHLPQAVYGTNAMVAEAYRGLGFTGGVPLMGGTSLEYDVYGGGLNREEFELPLDLYRYVQGTKPYDEVSGDEEEETTDQLYGGRVSLLPAVEGMKLGVSGYHAETYEPGTSAAKGWITTFGGHVEYVNGRYSLRSEYVRQYEDDNDSQNGWYVESAVRLTSNWQVAAMLNEQQTDPDGDVPALGAAILEHKEYVLGLNYYFAPNFVIKTSYHHVDGNRFSLPEKDVALDRLANGIALTETTNAVLLGAQFSF